PDARSHATTWCGSRWAAKSTASHPSTTRSPPRRPTTSAIPAPGPRCCTRPARPAGRRACAARSPSRPPCTAPTCATPSSTVSCTGPLYHAAPLSISLTAPLAAGAGVVLMDGWDPEETLRLIEQYRITTTHLVPTMFHRLLALPDEVKQRYDLSSLRLVVHGAAPCPVTVKQRMIEWLGPI